MSVRERILCLRLMEKAEKHPKYATALGLIWVQAPPKEEDDQKPP